MAVALLGVAVVAATGTADAPSGSLHVLPGPGQAGPSGSPMVAAPTAGPATSPSTADTLSPSGGTPSAGGSIGADPVSVRPAVLATALPDDRARTAVRVAMSQIGLPYVWGGDGPEAGDRGFDCSGLTHYAYDEAGIDLPRTAHTQFRAGPRVPDGAPLQPGDLVFYGTYRKVHHVGMYIGGGRMVNAPTFGEPVQTAWYRWRGDDYIGASRPASSSRGSAPLADVPETPDPDVPSRDEFDAPAAPRPPDVPEPRSSQPPEADSASQSRTGSDADIAAGRVPVPPSALVPTPGTPTGGARPPTSPGLAAGLPTTTGTGAPTSPSTTTGLRSATTTPVPSGSAGSGSDATTGTSTMPQGGAVGPSTTDPQPSTTADQATPRITPSTTATPPTLSTAPSTPTTTPTTTPQASTTTPSVPATPTTPGVPTTSPTSTADPSTSTGPAATPTGGEPSGAATLTLGTRRMPVPTVRPASDGFAASPGIARGSRGWVVTLDEPLTTAPGAPVAVTLPDGRTLRWTVESRSAPGPRADLTPPTAPLVLLVPTGDGLWSVVTAR